MVTLAAEQIVRDEVRLGQLSCLDIAEPVALRVFGLYTKADREMGDLGKLFCRLVIELAPEFAKGNGALKT